MAYNAVSPIRWTSPPSYFPRKSAMSQIYCGMHNNAKNEFTRYHWRSLPHNPLAK